MSVVLDAWALVAYLKDEPSAGRVEEAIDRGEAICSDINLGEVVFSVARSHGEDRAVALVDRLRRLVRAEPPDWSLTLAAARIKSRHPLSYADGFAVATAQRHRAPLYTGDPEILALGSAVDSVDLRS